MTAMVTGVFPTLYCEKSSTSSPADPPGAEFADGYRLPLGRVVSTLLYGRDRLSKAYLRTEKTQLTNTRQLPPCATFNIRKLATPRSCPAFACRRLAAPDPLPTFDLIDCAPQNRHRPRCVSYIPQVEDTIWREFRWRSGGRNAHPARRVA